MKNMLYLSLAVLLFASCGPKKLVDENLPWSVRMARSEIIRNPDPSRLDFVTTKKWNYTNGLVCEAILDLYKKTGDKELLDYARQYADSMILADGEILTYKLSNYNIDHINPGKYLFRLYDITGETRLKTAIDTLRSQLKTHPRTSEGGYWHKKIYPWQIWLDGIYMGDVFKAEYISRYEEPSQFADVVLQFTLAAKHTYDPQTKLYRHGWDEKRQQKWADPVTGQSPHSWGRAMGWYAMAFVDALDYIPEGTPGRDSMIAIFSTMCRDLVPIQDETGTWYQVLDLSGEHGNYLESTCTAMFTYAFLKGARMGYLPQEFVEIGKKAYNGMLNTFIRVDDDGLVNITNCCAVAGLGGNPYRDGSYEYYLSEKVRDNDPKGVGPFIMASLEMERLTE